MKLLNLGAGGNRPQTSKWINLDNLRTQLAPGTPERRNLDAETNYVEHDLLEPLPFEDGHFDGILASHVLEHFEAHDAIKVMKECHRVLARGGMLFVSVPDAAYFREVYVQDRNEDWMELFGERDPSLIGQKFFDVALWFHEHKVLFTADVLWCYFVRAGFAIGVAFDWLEPVRAMTQILTRRKFSVEMVGFKL